MFLYSRLMFLCSWCASPTCESVKPLPLVGVALPQTLCLFFIVSVVHLVALVTFTGKWTFMPPCLSWSSSFQCMLPIRSSVTWGLVSYSYWEWSLEEMCQIPSIPLILCSFFPLCCNPSIVFSLFLFLSLSVPLLFYFPNLSFLSLIVL